MSMYGKNHHNIVISLQLKLKKKKPSANEGDIRDTDLIPGWGRHPGEGNGNPLQYSCLENPWTEEPGWL